MKLFIIICSLILVSCGSDSKKSDRSILEKLNGNSYETSNTMAMFAPAVLTEQPTIRKGTGQLYCGEGISQVSAQKADISISDGNRVITKTTSDQYGQYNLVGKYAKDKKYTLKISSKCGSIYGPVQWTHDIMQFQDIMLKK